MKLSGVSRAGEKEGRVDEHGGSLGQWNCSAQSYNGGHMSLYSCLNPQHVYPTGESQCALRACG